MEWWVKAGVVVALLAIVASLGVALVRLVQDKGRTDRTVKALTFRIGLSFALFLLLLFGFLSGMIVPHGVVP